MSRHFKWLCLALWALPAIAADLALVGVIGDKAAILAIEGGAPRTVKVGQTISGVTVVAVERNPERAIVEVDGKRRALVRGQTYSTGGGGERQTVTLSAGAGGHFIAQGQINGGAIRFLVDTGATAISLPAADANRLRIDYRRGQRVTTKTAAGDTPAYVVRLESVRLGGIELQNIEAIVIERGLDVALLGMTFLNRVEMRREGQTMTLTRRF